MSVAIDSTVRDIEEQIARLRDEEQRLVKARDALRGQSQSQGHGGRSRRATTSKPPRTRTRQAPSKDPGEERTPTRATVLEYLRKNHERGCTAGEIAKNTGLGRASVSTTLSKLARAGEIQKLDRGYTVK